MASAQWVRGSALIGRGEVRWTQPRGRVLCFYGTGWRRGIFMCPPVLSVRFPTCSSLMLMVWTQLYIFLCLCATLGDFDTGVAAAAEQHEQQWASLLDNNTLALGWKKQIALSRRMGTASKATSPDDLRMLKEATAAGSVPSDAPPREAGAVRSTRREEAGVAAAVRTATVSVPATATAAAGRAERSTGPAAATTGREACTLLRGTARATAARCEARTSTVEHAGAGGATAAVPLHASGLLLFIDAAAGEEETSLDGSTVRRLNSARMANVSKLQGGASHLPKRFGGGLTRRLSAETHACVATEAARTERVPEGSQALQLKLDELLGDVREYAELRREREFNEVAKKYADEDAIPEEEVSMLNHARSDLNRLRNWQRIWIKLLWSSVTACVCAVFSLSLLLSEKEVAKALLDHEYQRRRQTSLRLASVVALSGLLAGLFGNWRRRALNRKVYLQELETDRIALEAVAGIRPTKKNVLGPSMKEIEQHRKELQKKAKEQKM